MNAMLRSTDRPISQTYRLALLDLDGVVYRGKNPVELLPGDAVHIPAGVKHWHGAAPDSWFSHLAVEVPSEDSSNEWLEPVDEKEYAKLK